MGRAGLNERTGLGNKKSETVGMVCDFFFLVYNKKVNKIAELGERV